MPFMCYPPAYHWINKYYLSSSDYIFITGLYALNEYMLKLSCWMIMYCICLTLNAYVFYYMTLNSYILYYLRLNSYVPALLDIVYVPVLPDIDCICNCITWHWLHYLFWVIMFLYCLTSNESVTVHSVNEWLIMYLHD